MAIGGANSAPTLAGKTVRVVSCDEEDRYSDSVGGADCGAFQELKIGNLKFDDENPEDARYMCESCGVLHEEGAKFAMLSKGRWRARETFRGVAGFHLSSLYSPWTSWGKLARQYVEARKSPEKFKVFTNTKLAEIWKEKADVIPWKNLMARMENWGDVLPEGALVLTCGVDVQRDRIECEIVAWGEELESWSVAYHVFRSDDDPTLKPAFARLTQLLNSTWKHACGSNLRIACTAVDSGDNTQTVLNYVKAHLFESVYAVKGASDHAAPLIVMPTKKRDKRGRPKPVMVGGNTAKKMIYARLRMLNPGPGYCHFPTKRKEEWFRQLTVEQLVTKTVNGQRRQVFENPRDKRNEALDCRVYALAALEIYDPNMPSIKKDMERRAAKEKPPQSQQETPTAAEPSTAPPPTPKAKPAPKKKPTRRNQAEFLDLPEGWV